MKKFLLSLATAFSFVLFLGSCTNEEDINNNGYSDKEKAKIETLMNLFDSYGWELDTTVSIWKIQCKLPPKTKRFCPLVLK